MYERFLSFSHHCWRLHLIQNLREAFRAAARKTCCLESCWMSFPPCFCVLFVSILKKRKITAFTVARTHTHTHACMQMQSRRCHSCPRQAPKAFGALLHGPSAPLCNCPHASPATGPLLRRCCANNNVPLLQVFQGNFDNDTHRKNVIDPPIYARLIRILPWSWYGRITLRVEILGCIEEEWSLFSNCFFSFVSSFLCHCDPLHPTPAPPRPAPPELLEFHPVCLKQTVQAVKSISSGCFMFFFPSNTCSGWVTLGSFVQ